MPPLIAQCGSGRPERRNAGPATTGLFARAWGFDIELECQFPITLPPVIVDANQLEVALLNVALNARDAMPGGGRLLISAGETECAGTADLSLPPGDYVRMKFINTGG